MIRSRGQLRLSPDAVVSVHLPLCQGAADILVYDDPRTEAEAKFSVPFPLASAIVFDSIGIDPFAPEPLDTPMVQAVRARVEYRVDPDLPFAEPGGTMTIDTVDA